MANTEGTLGQGVAPEGEGNAHDVIFTDEGSRTGYKVIHVGDGGVPGHPDKAVVVFPEDGPEVIHPYATFEMDKEYTGGRYLLKIYEKIKDNPKKSFAVVGSIGGIAITVATILSKRHKK